MPQYSPRKYASMTLSELLGFTSKDNFILTQIKKATPNHRKNRAKNKAARRSRVINRRH